MNRVSYEEGSRGTGSALNNEILRFTSLRSVMLRMTGCATTNAAFTDKAWKNIFYYAAKGKQGRAAY